MSQKYFNLFSNCIIADGINRSLIMDLQRNKSYPIPNSMLNVINFLKIKNTYESTILNFGIENKYIIDEYIDFLIANELGFFLDEDEFSLFLDLDKTIKFPAHVTNIVIELSEFTIQFYDRIIKSIDDIIVQNIQLISYETIKFNELSKLLEKLKKCELKSVELVLKYSQELIDSINQFDDVINDVTSIIFHSVPKEINNDLDFITFEIIYTNEKIDGFKYCGVVKMEDFNVNQKKVLESISHNSCLNKKLSIDKDGNIKNCPSMPQSFGNIKDTTLEEALSHKDFKKYWNVNKDMIAVCKDCEFRHICTDCRAYTERTDFEGDIDLSKPLKCGYNPYTNYWAEWSTNPLKQKAIKYYGMQELVKKDA